MMYPTVVTRRRDRHHHFPARQSRAGVRRYFQSFGAKLPAPTQMLINISNFAASITSCASSSAAAVRSLAAGFTSSRRRPAAQFWDAHRIKLPIFGQIAHKICLARFTRTLASLVRSGVPILEVLADRAQHRRQRRHGKSDQRRRPAISNAAKASPTRWANIPFSRRMIIRMITAGEQTGKIDSCSNVSRTFWMKKSKRPFRPDRR